MFADVESRELDAALSRCEVRSFPPGAIVIAEGSEPGEMYVVREGSADVFMTDRGGREHPVGRVTAGGTIGEMSMLTEQPAGATVRAAEPLEVVVLDEAQLESLAEQMPRIYRNLAAILSNRLAKAQQRALGEHPGRLIAIADASAELCHALAASVAWHTRAPTVLVLVCERPSEIPVRASRGADPPFRRLAGTRGAEVIVTMPEGPFAPERIRVTLEALGGSFEHVLVRDLGESHGELGAAESIRLVLGPDLPALGEADLEEIREGWLSLRSEAGRELGRRVRALTGLRVGVALGAGSLRGYAHIGALEGFEELGVPIDVISGASVGSVVAGLYAYGSSYQRIADVLDELGKRMFRPTISRSSLLSTRPMRRYIRRRLGDALIESLPIPLGVVATDALSGEEVVLRSGSLSLALLASSAVPGIFPALNVGPHTLVDGGVVDPVPVGVVAQMGAGVGIGVKLISGRSALKMDGVSEQIVGPRPSSIGAILRSLELMQGRLTVDRDTIPSVVITPQFADLQGAKMRKFASGRRFIAGGREAVEQARLELAAVLPWLRES